MFRLSIFQPFLSLHQTNFRSNPESNLTDGRVLPYGIKLHRHIPVNKKYYLALLPLLTWFSRICLKPQFARCKHISRRVRRRLRM